MPGLDLKVVTHKLNVDPKAKFVKQPVRKYRLNVEGKIKVEVNKFFKAGFIEEIKCLEWLANIVLVKKKDGQIRICVDFRALNKACPKDEFPLPNVNILVNAFTRHEPFSFLDGCSGYNQIFMEPSDAQKTTFRTPFENFYYKMMHLRLKNGGAIYQRTMTLIFSDMLHKQVEDYVDDLVVKAKSPVKHLLHLRQVFERCKEYNLRMNPSKCAFGVSSGMFLGLLVHQRRIDLDPTKAKAITTLTPPANLKELRRFVGKVSYLRRFITSLAEILKPLVEQTKKGVTFVWCDQCEKAFKKIQEILADPHTMLASLPRKPLLLFIANIEQSLGALLAQEQGGMKRPVYYISRLMKGPELRYSIAENVCLSLAFAMSKFNHYFLRHHVQLVTKSNLVKYLLTHP